MSMSVFSWCREDLMAGRVCPLADSNSHSTSTSGITHPVPVSAVNNAKVRCHRLSYEIFFFLQRQKNTRLGINLKKESLTIISNIWNSRYIFLIIEYALKFRKKYALFLISTSKLVKVGMMIKIRKSSSSSIKYFLFPKQSHLICIFFKPNFL